MMRQATGYLSIATKGQGMIDITAAAADWCADQGMGQGLLTLLCQHTSASLTVQENASPDVPRDLARGMDRLAPRDFPWDHADEGPDDMPAHLRTVLSGVHLSIPLIGGRLALGVWQGVFLWEHRDRPHSRRVALHLIGG